MNLDLESLLVRVLLIIMLYLVNVVILETYLPTYYNKYIFMINLLFPKL